MKFASSIILTLGLSSSVLAVPVLEKKANTPLAAIGASLSTLQQTAGADQVAISNALASIKNDVTASAQIIAALGVNLTGIATALQTSGNEIYTATAGAAGGLAVTASGFTQYEIDILTTYIIQAVDFVKSVRATLTVTVTNLTPEARKAVASELAAVEAAIRPFVTPLQQFATAVQQARGSATLTITGLNNAIRGLLQLTLSAITNLIGVQL